MITLHRSSEDDPGFIEQAQWLVTGCIREYSPEEVYVIRIRDFFDYKWCYFSGKTLGAIGVSKFCDLTLPPFVPNRVISQDHYRRAGTNQDDYETSHASPLHIHQSSEANFKRFIRRTTNDGTAIWFSSGSRMTGRGSFMVYNVTPDIKFGWHVTFLKKAHWQIEKVTFTSKALVEALRDSGSNKQLQATSG
ncbi:MAG TPA: hypothetical protein VGO67_24150 [Verrucomicrobiae bacterium]|jgi:hypothetical protein